MMRGLVAYSDDDEDDQIQRSLKKSTSSNLKASTLKITKLRLNDNPQSRPGASVHEKSEMGTPNATSSGTRRQGTTPNQLANIIRKPVAGPSPSVSATSSRGSYNHHKGSASSSTSGRYERMEASSSVTASSRLTKEDETERIRELLQPPAIEGMDDWGILPKPAKQCDGMLEAKVARFHELKQQGKHFNDSLMQSKAFRNPHIYTKLVDFVDITETATNFPKELWDPFEGLDQWSAEKLAARQKERSEQLSAKQAPGQRSKIAFESSSSSNTRHSSSQSNKYAPGSSSKAVKEDRNRDYHSRYEQDRGRERRYHPYDKGTGSSRWSDGAGESSKGDGGDGRGDARDWQADRR